MADLVTRIPLPGSPNNLLLNKFADTLYVPQDNSDNVAVINTASNQIVEEIDAIAPPGVLADKSSRYTGAATNNVALSPDEKTLYVTNGGANALAIVPLTGAAPHTVAGLMPTGWYPTKVTISADGGTMYVFDSRSDLDNFFDSGEVSGNGWPWSTAGRETDWNEKTIPMDYTFGVNRGRAPYDAEGRADAGL